MFAKSSQVRYCKILNDFLERTYFVTWILRILTTGYNTAMYYDNKKYA